MTEPEITGQPASKLAEPRLQKRRRLPSSIWLVPLLALLISAWVVWNNYNDRGPLVTITFQSASGISAGTTEVRIRDLRVGVVETVGFAEGMGAIEVGVRFDKKIAQYIDRDAQFWLVQPTVTARGVSGIGTLLSGVYIAADWDGVEGIAETRFTAQAIPPLAATGEAGTRIVLRARAGGQLAAGAPVLTSGIEVGRIGQPRLSESGSMVTMEAFIFAPYDERLTTNARFWDASGLSLNLGTQGLALRVDSFAALLEGGVTFGNPVTGGERVRDGHTYDVFASEDVARADAFENKSEADLPLSILLPADVEGLGVDTIVRFRGIKVGQVVDVVGIAPEAGSNESVQLRIDMAVSRTRLGIPSDMLMDDVRALLEQRVANGLRARTSAEGLFGQSTVLEIANLRSVPEAALVVADDGRIFIPTVAPAARDPNTGVNSLLDRVANLPIEDLIDAASLALASISNLTATAEGVLAAEGMDQIPTKIDGILEEARIMITEVREGGSIETLNATLKSADTALATVTDEIGATLGAVQTLVRTISNEGGAIDNLNLALLSADGALQTVDVSVRETLEQAEALIADLRDGGAVDNVNETLTDVRGLIGDLRDGGAVDNLNATLKSADSALQSIDGVAADTLAELQGLMQDLREGGAIESLNATLKSADSALQSVDTAVSSLPALAARLNATADSLQAVVNGYNTESRLYGDMRTVLKDISSTADSFRSLARSIERNPSSLITGRR